MRLALLIVIPVLAVAGEMSQEEQDRIWREALKQSAATPAKQAESPNPAPTVDYDALAAQRHAEAQARDRAAQAEMKRQQEAHAADRAAKAPQDVAWVVPEGKSVSEVPAWARGEWSFGDSNNTSSWVFGAKIASVDGQKPMPYLSIIEGDDWVFLCFITRQGPAVVLRRSDGGMLLGGVEFPDRLRPSVSLWRGAMPRR